MKDTVIIAGFPGVGKSHFFKTFKEKDVIDSDSSTFPKDNFPSNYIQHIKSNIGEKDAILISTHKEVLSGLINEGIEFAIVYPNRHIKDEYLRRYINRGSPVEFVKLIGEKWDDFLNDIETLEIEKDCRIVLHSGQFISDIEWNFLHDK